MEWFGKESAVKPRCFLLLASSNAFNSSDVVFDFAVFSQRRVVIYVNVLALFLLCTALRWIMPRDRG